VSAYEQRQFDQIEDGSDFYRLQVTSDSKCTRWLNISPEQFEEIRKTLVAPEPHLEDSEVISALFAEVEGCWKQIEAARMLITTIREKKGLNPRDGIEEGGVGKRGKFPQVPPGTRVKFLDEPAPWQPPAWDTER
jgi:hypothetical protein